MCYWPSGSSVWWKTVTEILKMLQAPQGSILMAKFTVFTIPTNHKLANNMLTVSFLPAVWAAAAWLAQLVGRQSAVREVEGSSPRPDQHSGS